MTRRLYRGINGREPLVYGLPSKVFFVSIAPLAAFSLFMLKFVLMIGIVSLGVTVFLYIGLQGLKQKHGMMFLSKLIHYHFDSYWIIRRRRAGLK